jgi:hypothetical protein
LVNVDQAHLIDGFLYGRHFSLHCGFKDTRVGSILVVYGRQSVPVLSPIADGVRRQGRFYL